MIDIMNSDNLVDINVNNGEHSIVIDATAEAFKDAFTSDVDALLNLINSSTRHVDVSVGVSLSAWVYPELVFNENCPIAIKLKSEMFASMADDVLRFVNGIDSNADADVFFNVYVNEAAQI